MWRCKSLSCWRFPFILSSKFATFWVSVDQFKINYDIVSWPDWYQPPPSNKSWFRPMRGKSPGVSGGWQMPSPQDTQKSQMPHPRDLQGTQMEFDALYLDENLNLKKGKRKKLWIYKSFHRKYFLSNVLNNLRYTLRQYERYAMSVKQTFVSLKREQQIYIKPFKRKKIWITSSPSFFLRDSRARETRARVKITPCEKGETQGEKNVFFLPSASLLSLRKNEGLLVVLRFWTPSFLDYFN